jgi:hypothetical protein
LTLGIIQVLTVVGIIAGAWNIYAATTRIKVAPRIERRESGVPSAFASLTGYVIIGVINLVLGGVIGLILLGVDLYVRDQVLKHRNLFGVNVQQAPVGTTPLDADPNLHAPQAVRESQVGQTVVDAPGFG